MYTFEILDTNGDTFYIPIEEVTYYEIDEVENSIYIETDDYEFELQKDDEVICALLNYFNPVNEN